MHIADTPPIFGTSHPACGPTINLADRQHSWRTNCSVEQIGLTCPILVRPLGPAGPSSRTSRFILAEKRVHTVFGLSTLELQHDQESTTGPAADVAAVTAAVKAAAVTAAAVATAAAAAVAAIVVTVVAVAAAASAAAKYYHLQEQRHPDAPSAPVKRILGSNDYSAKGYY